MQKVLALIACFSLVGCATPLQSTGTAAGAVSGAVIGGPVGAVVGGAAGALVTAPGGPLSPGYCYVRGRHGQILRYPSGRARVRRC
jgi:uncharacterized protein YcfJ